MANKVTVETNLQEQRPCRPLRRRPRLNRLLQFDETTRPGVALSRDFTQPPDVTIDLGHEDGGEVRQARRKQEERSSEAEQVPDDAQLSGPRLL